MNEGINFDKSLVITFLVIFYFDVLILEKKLGIEEFNVTQFLNNAFSMSCFTFQFP